MKNGKGIKKKMTVNELIKELQKMPEDRKVLFFYEGTSELIDINRIVHVEMGDVDKIENDWIEIGQ